MNFSENNISDFAAKSASDKNDNWPIWMLWDNKRNFNVTREAAEFIGINLPPGQVLTDEKSAKYIYAILTKTEFNSNTENKKTTEIVDDLTLYLIAKSVTNAQRSGKDNEQD